MFAGIMAFVLLATGLFLRLRLGTELDQSIDRDLRSRSDQLISLIRTGEAHLGEPVRSVLRRRGESFSQVLKRAGGLYDPRAEPPNRPVLNRTELEQARREPTFVERSGAPGLGSEPVRLLATPIRFEQNRVIVVVGTSLDDRSEALASLTTLLLIGGPAALVLASLAAYWTVGAALRPVEAMRRRAAEISAVESEQRLPVPPARDELHRLGETLNRMLERLQAALKRERAFVDDASHELRTPLAMHKSELELALRYGGSTEELRAAIASAIEEADRLAQLAENLLVIARSDKGRLAVKLESVEVAGLFTAVRERLSARAHELGREVVIDDADGLVIQADRLRVEQALTNLVENAMRHGDGTIRLWSRTGSDGVELHVSDAGPGFPAGFVPHAFERFRRADTARGEGGTGLGLAIVEAIANAHGGRAAAVNTPEGGADVWIELRAG